MHGSVCLFSKYLEHLLEGENLDELDISSASSSENIFSGQKTLSTGWTGTCPLVNYYDNIYYNYSSGLNSLTNIFSSEHKSLLDLFSSTQVIIDNLYTYRTISSARPSGATASLTPKGEYEFSDKTNNGLIGGQIYSNFTNKLKANLETLNSTIKNGIINYEANDQYKISLDGAYENFVNFDKAVATASSVMNKRILDLKDYFLSVQFFLMFFTWGYMIFFCAIIFFYVCYFCNNNSIFWYIIIILVNLLFIMMLVEIFLSAFFGQIRLICHEIPRAIRFIFTGDYIVSGNSATYPAKFGTGNANMTKMFTTCLNGDGNLVNLFITSSSLSTLTELRNNVTKTYLQVKQIVDNSNLITNNYDNIQNSILLKTIYNYETMKENLYMATEGFGNDDINIILRNIRTYLDYSNCSMTEEYYVVREADCPAGSVKLTYIQAVTGIIHCYIIQNLGSYETASYSNSGCSTANAYINLAVPFIKEIYNIIDFRLLLLKSFQITYTNTFSSLSNEITSISEKINSTYNILNSDTDSSAISNCGSVKFDLIDFCDFIGDTTEYDARIVVIFSAFVGVFGFVMLYSFLVVMNGFSYNDLDNDDDYVNDFGKSKNKIRNINNNVYKPKPIKRESLDEEEEEEEEEDNKKKPLNSKRKPNIPVKTGQKVEMSYLSKNNDDSDSS